MRIKSPLPAITGQNEGLQCTKYRIAKASQEKYEFQVKITTLMIERSETKVSWSPWSPRANNWTIFIFRFVRMCVRCFVVWVFSCCGFDICWLLYVSLFCIFYVVCITITIRVFMHSCDFLFVINRHSSSQQLCCATYIRFVTWSPIKNPARHSNNVLAYETKEANEQARRERHQASSNQWLVGV